MLKNLYIYCASISNIFFKNKKLQKIFSDEKKLLKKYEKQNAEKIKQHMNELDAAANLAEISMLPPPRCHELSGDKLGIFTVDISANYRLFFQPDGIKIPRKGDVLDLAKIDKIIVLGVYDPH